MSHLFFFNVKYCRKCGIKFWKKKKNEKSFHLKIWKGKFESLKNKILNFRLDEMNRRQWRIVTRPHYRLFTSGISTGDGEEMLARRYGYTGVHRGRCASGAWNKEEGKSSHMPENVNHVQVHEVLAYNTFNVIMLVQETMQKIVSDNLLACYIIYG